MMTMVASNKFQGLATKGWYQRAKALRASSAAKKATKPRLSWLRSIWEGVPD